MNKLPDIQDQISDNTSMGPDRNLPPGTPRWVKWFGIISLVLILLFVVLHLTGLVGGHGASHHMSFGDHTSQMENGGNQP